MQDFISLLCELILGGIIWFVKEYALDTKLRSQVELGVMHPVRRGVKFASYLSNGMGHGVLAVGTDYEESPGT